MFYKTILFALTFFSLPSLLAHETRPLSQIYRFETQSFLDKLKNAGVKKIGCSLSNPDDTCVTIAELSKALEDSSFVALANFSKDKFATRWSAFNDPLNKTIYVNEEKNEDKVLIGPNGFHEIVQIASYERFEGTRTLDVEFELTMHAMNIAEESSSSYSDSQNLINLLEFPFRYVKALEDKHFRANQILYTASGTFVGGGGDLDTLRIKREVEKKFKLFLGSRYSYSYTAIWPSIRIEITRDENVEEIIFDIVRADNPLRSVFIPFQKDHEESIDEIFWVLSSLHMGLNEKESSNVVTKNKAGLSMVSMPIPNRLDQIHPLVLEKIWMPYILKLCPDLTCVQGRGL